MKYQIQSLVTFLKTPFPYAFLIVGFSLSLAMLQTENFFSSIQNENTHRQLQERAEQEREEKFEFSFAIHQPTPEEFLIDFVHLVGTLLVAPAGLATTISMDLAAATFPNFELTAYEVTAVFLFLYFNLNAWLLSSFLIYRTHESYTEVNISKNRLQTIFTSLEC